MIIQNIPIPPRTTSAPPSHSDSARTHVRVPLTFQPARNHFRISLQYIPSPPGNDPASPPPCSAAPPSPSWAAPPSPSSAGANIAKNRMRSECVTTRSAAPHEGQKSLDGTLD